MSRTHDTRRLDNGCGSRFFLHRVTASEEPSGVHSLQPHAPPSHYRQLPSPCCEGGTTLHRRFLWIDDSIHDLSGNVKRGNVVFFLFFDRKHQMIGTYHEGCLTGRGTETLLRGITPAAAASTSAWAAAPQNRPGPAPGASSRWTCAPPESPSDPPGWCRRTCPGYSTTGSSPH